MILAATSIVFVALLLLSLPIVFCLGAAGVTGLLLGGFPLQQLGSTLIAASQSWVLLAIPSFVFAGSLMERAGMSSSLVELARALVGWLRGGLGMSVIVVSYFFSDICGSKMAEVSALGSALMPPLRRAGYRAEDAASLIAAGTAMGMLVPPAIFMIVIAAVTNQSAVALFLAGFIPAAVVGLCLCILVVIQAHILGWPKDTATSWNRLLHASKEAAVPMVIPVVILGGFYLGAFTATEAGAIVAFYSLIAAKFYYRNVTWMQVLHIAYDSGVLTGVVIFLLAVATVFQYLMGLSGVPELLGRLLEPLEVAALAVPDRRRDDDAAVRHAARGAARRGGADPGGVPGRHQDRHPPGSFRHRADRRRRHRPVHAADGCRPADGAALRRVPVLQHARSYWPYLLALLVGLMLIICIPELSLFLPRSAGLIK